MHARDIMTTQVVTISAGASLRELVELLIARGISAIPVVGPKGEIVGIVSEGDLVRRTELETSRTRNWWLTLFTGREELAREFVKANTKKVSDIMTRDVITVAPNTPLAEVARLLERHGVKRVPVVSNRQLVGIVSRANLVQALATNEAKPHLTVSPSDAEVRQRILRRLENEPWASTSLLNVLVNDGIVDLWGFVQTSAERAAVRVAAEATTGVRAVNDHLVLRPTYVGV